MFLKQSTAATARLGPFVDAGDGSTLEDGLTIAASDVLLSKAGGALAAKGDATAAAYDAGGMYAVTLNTTDTGTLGRLDVVVAVAGARPVRASFVVLPTNVFNWMVGGLDKLVLEQLYLASETVSPLVIDCGHATLGAATISSVGTRGTMDIVNSGDGVAVNAEGGVGQAGIQGSINGTLDGVELSDIKAKTDLITSAAITTVVTSHVATDGTITVYQGDDSAISLSRTWTGADLSGVVTVAFKAQTMAEWQRDSTSTPLSTTGTLSIDGTTHTVAVTLTDTQTDALSGVATGQPNYHYQVTVTKGTNTYTLFAGDMLVVRKVA